MADFAPVEPDLPYCVACGERLAAGRARCAACGAERWTGEGRPVRPQPSQAQPAPVPALAWIYAAGAIMWLVLLASNAGVLAAAAGREQIAREVARAGSTGEMAQAAFALAAGSSVVVPLAVAALHAIAFYGLRGARRWGWLAAVLVAGAWSLVLVGIPVLAVLLRPEVRRAYGVR